MEGFVVRRSRSAVAGVLVLTVVVVLAALLPVGVSAQGILLVRVRGSGGHPVENATVRVSYLGTVVRTAGTDAKGAARR